MWTWTHVKARANGEKYEDTVVENQALWYKKELLEEINKGQGDLRKAAAGKSKMRQAKMLRKIGVIRLKQGQGHSNICSYISYSFPMCFVVFCCNLSYFALL